MTERNPEPTDPATEPIELDTRPATPPPPGGWLEAVRTHLAFAFVVLVTLAGVVLILLYYWRKGAGLIGGALVLAAGFRALLSPRRAGLLAVRGRAVDVLSYASLGVLIMFVDVTIAGGPLG